MSISLLIAVLVIYVPFFHKAFGTAAIPVEYWFFPIPFAILILLLEEIRKLWVKRNPESVLARLAW
jgi:sodium/potassium-transporting ATPase subunit alpha